MNETNDSAIVASIAMLNKNRNEFIGLFVIGFVALVTNPLIIWTIWRQKVLHTGCFVLIAQLALADFFVGASFTMSMIKRFIRIECFLGEIISQLQCAFEMAPNYFSESASLCLALAVGCERLLAAAIPIKFMTYQWKIARIVSIIAWIIPVVDCSIMLGVMIANPWNMINFCTSATAISKAFDAYQQVEKNCLTAIVVLAYVLVLLTISLQVRAAKKQNQQNIATIRKNLQLKMIRILVAIAMMYLFLQMAPRIGLIYIAKLPQDQRIKIGPIFRMLMASNSGIHFFVYLGTSTDFREAFFKGIGIKRSSKRVQTITVRSIL